MKVKVLFFGYVAQTTGVMGMELSAGDTDQLRNIISKQFPALEKMPFAIALNHDIIRQNTRLNENDEVAFLPPFAGG